MSKQTNYGPEERSDATALWRWVGILLATLLLLSLGFLIRGCTGPTTEVEVTRVVSQTEVTERPITRTVEEVVEVTRLVPELVITEIPVTRIVTKTAVAVPASIWKLGGTR